MHEMVTTQPGFKPSKVPFDLRYAPIYDYMSQHGIEQWADYYEDDAQNVIADYINGIRHGKIKITDPFFFNNHYRWCTNRVVFKVLHACEDRIGWFEEAFNSKIIYMLRHPVPVAYSRAQIPRLETFITSKYNRFFSNEQLKYAKGILDTGSLLQKAVCDWAFQNSVSLRNIGENWTVVSYEQLVVEPEPIIEALANNLALPNVDVLRNRLYYPSHSTRWSDDATNSRLMSLKNLNEQERKTTNDWLIHEKWRSKISCTDRAQLTEILDVFELDIYSIDSPMPHSRYWVN